MTDDKLLHLFKLWPGRSQFFCRGVLMTGPCVSVSLVMWIIIIVPVVVFINVILPVAFERHPIVAFSALALIAQMVLLLFATSCSDPGVIPSRSVIQALGIADEISDALGYCVLGNGEPTRDPRIDAKDIVPSELQGKKYAWCWTCEIIRPPRASHCASCDQCVLRYDHHCPFVNNCIAQRNYHYFIGFLFSVLVAAVFGLLVTVWWAAIKTEELHDRLYDIKPSAKAASSSGSVTSLVYTVSIGVSAVSCCVFGFLGYHIFLICNGKTTKEQKVKHQEWTSKPTLSAPRGPSLFNARALVSQKYMAEAAALKKAGLEAYRYRIKLEKEESRARKKGKRKHHREGWLGPIELPSICTAIRRCRYKLGHARWRKYFPWLEKREAHAIIQDVRCGDLATAIVDVQKV